MRGRLQGGGDRLDTGVGGLRGGDADAEGELRIARRPALEGNGDPDDAGERLLGIQGPPPLAGTAI